jgi:hypothetical protein
VVVKANTATISPTWPVMASRSPGQKAKLACSRFRGERCDPGHTAKGIAQSRY